MNKHILTLLAVTLLVFTLVACQASTSAFMPPPPSTVIPPELISELDAMLSELAKQALFTGSVLIACQGDVLLSQGYGLADREKNILNTAQTRFRLASITKQFTAMAILILEAEGKLNVKEPISNYIVDCPSTWEAITIDHLLTHTSGIPDFTGFRDYRSTQAIPSSPEQTIARFKDLPLDFQPGEKWSYSNSGYVVLGYIIERASGQSYEEFLKQSIFIPLNLRDTGYDHNSNGLAVGYPNQYSTLPAEFIDMSIPYAAGALYSTVEDLYRWEQALSTEQLVPQAYLDQMFAPHVAIPDYAIPEEYVGQALSYDGGWAYGYGWFIGTERGRPILTHRGDIEGFSTIIARYPDEQVTLIVLSNQQNNTAAIIHVLSTKIFGYN
ncbi:MAG: beta-lactamase family protein [Dehalococcoidales bacterium]|nr:beta-lactamase family protein [Dehalococcoidales bacterium]